MDPGLRLLGILGPGGIRAALRDSLDHAALTGLAETCRLKARGRRPGAAQRELLLDGLLESFLRDARTRAAVIESLARANGEPSAAVASLGGEDLSAWPERLPGLDPGRALFALAADGREEAAAAARALLPQASRREPASAQEQPRARELDETTRSRPAGADPLLSCFDALAAGVDALRREVAEIGRRQREESQRAVRAEQDLAAIRSELAQWRKAADQPVSRRRGEPDRVGLFVDVQNMYYAARQLNARLDFGALMTAVSRHRRLIRATAYVVQNRDIDQTGFLTMLQQKNYEVRRKDLKVRHDGSSKGDWDMEMALDILRLAGSLDVVALVSGDGDFASLVSQVKALGPRVEVYSFPGSTARELMEAADRHIPIDEGFLIRMPGTPEADQPLKVTNRGGPGPSKER